MSEKIILTESDLPDLVVKPEDLPPANTPQWDSVLGFYKGEPWVKGTDGSLFFSIPEIPHVFRGIVRMNDGASRSSRQEANILVAHGFRNANGEWLFKDGRSVRDFIGTYDINNPAAPISAVAVCNPTSEIQDSVVQAFEGSLEVSGYVDSRETRNVLSLRPENSDQNLIIVPVSGYEQT